MRNETRETYIIPKADLGPYRQLQKIVSALNLNGLSHLLTNDGLLFEATSQEIKNTVSTFELRSIKASFRQLASEAK